MNRRRIILVALVPLAVLSCRGAAPEESVETDAPVPVQVTAAGPSTVNVQILATGTTLAAPGAELTVTAPQPARIVSVPAGEGDHVGKGALLVEFEIPSLAADVAAREGDLAQARARQSNARSTRDRLAGLLDRGIAARREVDDATRDLAEADAAVAQATAGLQSAQQLAARQRVTAPFDCVVVRRWHNPGDLVDASAGDPVLRVADPDRVEVEAQVPAPDVSRIAPGQPALVEGPGGTRWRASVVARPAAVDPTTASAHVRLRLVGADPPALGLPVSVAITVLTREAAVAVPATALEREGDVTVVFVAADGKATRREVTTGAVSQERAEILSGVTAGERVIVSGQAGLPDGATVTVTP